MQLPIAQIIATLPGYGTERKALADYIAGTVIMKEAFAQIEAEQKAQS